MGKEIQLKHSFFLVSTVCAMGRWYKRRSGLMASVAVVILSLLSTNVDAQAVKLPPFTMTQTDGKTFKAASLPVGKPVIVIYFSPECEHCQKMMSEFFKRTNEFKKASVVMITYLSVETVQKFSSEYKTSKYPNIYVGTEGISFYLKNYYKLVNMPFTALYDKNGNLVSTYGQEVTVTDLARKLAIL